MSYQLKYYYNFKTIYDNSFKVELYENISSSITASLVNADYNEFIVEYPTIKTKLDCIRGSGAEFSLLSTSNMMFTNLYTNEMFKYKVVLKDNADSSIKWHGFLTTETYTEPYSSIDNYSVHLTATDGFSLLDRLYFVDDSGNNYSDIKSQWDVLKICLQKLGLTYNSINIGLSTTISDETFANNETIFHKQHSITTNYYDEDFQPFTCRKVIEGILQPLGAFIIQVNGSIYITDHNTIFNASSNFKQYDSSFSYVQDVAINMNIGDLSVIGAASNEQNYNVVNGINKQKITYSPYRLNKIIDCNESNDFKTPLTSTIYGASPYRWSSTPYSTSDTWYNYNNGTFIKQQGIETNNIKDFDYFLDIPRYPDSYGSRGIYAYQPQYKSFSYKKVLPYLIPANYKLKVECQLFARKTDDYNNPSLNNSASDLYSILLMCDLKIGNKKYVNSVNFFNPNNYYPTELSNLVKSSKTAYGQWMDITSSTNGLQLDFRQALTWMEKYDNPTDWYLNTPVEDTWVSLNDYQYQVGYYQPIIKDYLIPLDGIQGGIMSFDIYKWDGMKNYAGDQVMFDTALTDSIKDVRIKNLKISLVDANNNEVSDSDLEYIGYFDKKFKNDGEEISLIHGTNITNNPVERGAILGYKNNNYYFIKDWVRENCTSNVETLLLRSIQSNYKFPSIQLTYSTNRINTNLGYLTHSTYQGAKKFMIAGITHNYSNESSDIVMIEFNKDTLDINKSF